MAHDTILIGKKDNYFQITHYFQNSILSITNFTSKFWSWGTKTNTENLLWGNKPAKIKHDKLFNNFTEAGVKSVDIKHKISALKCSWIRRLYNKNFHEWKLIPLRHIFVKNFKFHSNLHIPSELICTFPSFYQDIIVSWCNYLLIFANIALNNFSIFIVQYLYQKWK